CFCGKPIPLRDLRDLREIPNTSSARSAGSVGSARSAGSHKHFLYEICGKSQPLPLQDLRDLRDLREIPNTSSARFARSAGNTKHFLCVICEICGKYHPILNTFISSLLLRRSGSVVVIQAYIHPKPKISV